MLSHRYGNFIKKTKKNRIEKMIKYELLGIEDKKINVVGLCSITFGTDMILGCFCLKEI